jgi:phosphatidylglycerophosphate synthase
VRAVLTARRDSQPQRQLAGLGMALRAVLELQAAGATEICCRVSHVDVDVDLAELREDLRVAIPLHANTDNLSNDELVLVHDLETLVPRELLRELIELGAPAVAVGPKGRLGPLVQLAECLDAPQEVARFSSGHWSVDLRQPGAEVEARRRLFEACRKPVDGLVSRHVNRHISLAISRLLVDTRVSPNAMTLVTFSIAVFASWMALRADYLSTAWAGVLMQINSILDGCDGELARVRHQGSRLGQWLDTVADDLSNVIFWAALGYGALALPTNGRWYFWAGCLAALANLLAAALNYAVLYRIGSGDFYALDASNDSTKSTGLASIVDGVSLLFKQDFFLFATMVLALLGLLHQSLPIVALGAVITFVNSAVRAGRFFALQKRSSVG